MIKGHTTLTYRGKMILIAHRGNLLGPKPSLENHPSYIMKAILSGYDVEIDVWWVKDNFYLGHDSPDYKIDKNFLSNRHLWCHAKNFAALGKLEDIGSHYFWHEEDDYTITSNGFIWTYPLKS